MKRVFSPPFRSKHTPFLSMNFMALPFNSQMHSFCYTVRPGSNSRNSKPHPCPLFLKQLCLLLKPSHGHKWCGSLCLASSVRPGSTSCSVNWICVWGKMRCPGVTVICVINRRWPWYASETAWKADLSVSLPGLSGQCLSRWCEFTHWPAAFWVPD